MRFYNERVENSRNFANKVWNASRFIMMNMAEGAPSAIHQPMPAGLEPVDHWILSKLNKTIREVTDNMDKFELGIAVQKVYDFIWDEFCDWYIEMVKPRLYNSDDAVSHEAALWTLQTVLINALKLLHPYMPFITEEIFCTLQDEEESIMISDWPVYKDEWNFADDEKAIETIKEAVRGIRNVRTQMNVAPSRKAKVFVVSDNKETLDIFTTGKLFFEALAYASESVCQSGKDGIADDAVSVVLADATVYIPFADLVDISAEIDRLKKEKSKLEGELKRSQNMLSNEKFLSKAPADKIAEEKEKQQKYQQTYDQITERLKQLEG
jgi:valyl-tRNA synthetase